VKVGRSGPTTKPICQGHEAIRKQKDLSIHRVDKGIRVMWHIINAIYEDYCQARLDEMLKLDVLN
jgi:hypothetical protein